jgi:hypothetical protein
MRQGTNSFHSGVLGFGPPAGVDPQLLHLTFDSGAPGAPFHTGRSWRAAGNIVLALVSITDSVTIFPAAFLTAIEILSLRTSMPMYLVLVIRVFLSGGVEPKAQNLLQKGRSFILRRGD